MKLQTRTIVALLLLLVFLPSTAQNADRQALSLMAEGQPFALRKLLDQQGDSLSKGAKALAEAYVKGCLGDASHAARDMRRALKKHTALIDPQLAQQLTFGTALQYHRAGKDRKAARTLAKYRQRLSMDSVHDSVSSGWQRTFHNYEQLYSICRKHRQEVLCPGEASVPFRMDSVGAKDARSVAIRILSVVNGRQATFMLDTGSSLNVVSRVMADSLRLQMLGVSVFFDGMGENCGQMALAKLVSMGNIVIRNVLFCVIDSPIDSNSSDESTAHLNAILGWPLLEAFGEVQLDFLTHVIKATARKTMKTTKNTDEMVNLCYGFSDNGVLVEVFHHGQPVRLIPDTGATHSVLSTADAPAQRDYIMSSFTSREVELVGWGGRKTGREYLYPQYDVAVGKVVVSLPVMSVFDGSDYDSRLGMDFFSRCERVLFRLSAPMRMSVIR